MIAPLAPALVEITADGRPLESESVVAVDVLLAVDRPDRLDLAAAGDPAWGPDSRVSASLEGTRLFSGRAERIGLVFDGARGASSTLVAHADFHRLRPALPAARWFQSTDAEAAQATAAELELSASIEPTRAIHASIEREGDPLAFLRGRARECGFELAVTGGVLYFRRELPAPFDPFTVSPRDLLRFSIDGAGGTLDARGDPRFRPLALFHVRGLGARAHGPFRVVRALHTIDEDGYRTGVQFHGVRGKNGSREGNEAS